jgi:hypothetical protein
VDCLGLGTSLSALLGLGASRQPTMGTTDVLPLYGRRTAL